MDLSIIIVSWNVKNILADNLRELYRVRPGMKWEIFVVDNDSQDGTAEMVSRDFPQVKLVANNENLGFAKANNQAIKRSGGRYVLLLNPDMRVKEGALEKMVAWMDKHPEVGVAGCRLKDEKGNDLPHVRRFPRLFDQLAIVLKLPHIFPAVLNTYLQKDFDYTRESEVDSIRGSFFMVRREALEQVGLLDERFFIWFEEVDYCRRVKKAGWQVAYTPVAECIDLVGKSFAQVRTGRTQQYFRDSMLKYFRKWHRPWQYQVLRLAWPIGIRIAEVGGRFKRDKK